MLAGLHGKEEGSKGLEGSTPSLRKQLSFISPNLSPGLSVEIVTNAIGTT
jgi:hypothetical protein